MTDRPPGSDPALTLSADELGELRSPVMLIGLRGWFDAASAATNALEAVSPGDASVTVGAIDPDPFFNFAVERPYTGLDDDGNRFVAWPQTVIRVVRHPSRDVVVVTGVEPHLHWRGYSRALIDAAQQLACQVVVTVGAAADTVPHTRTPPVVGSTTDADLARRLGLAAPSYQGITGLIGTLLVELDVVGITAVSMRVAVPHYLANHEHPRASVALLTHLSHVLGVPFDADLSDAIQTAAETHDEMLRNDDALRMYVEMLERQFDQRSEASIPSADELGQQFEEFLRDQRED